MADDNARALPVSFSAFIVSLASSAMVHLGLTDDPAGGGPNVDLMLARHTIDVLGLLDEKTKGNLDEDEARLLETLLSDLRLQFVEVSKRK